MASDIVRSDQGFKSVYQKQWRLAQTSSKWGCKYLKLRKQHYCNFTHVKNEWFVFQISSLIENLVKTVTFQCLVILNEHFVDAT